MRREGRGERFTLAIFKFRFHLYGISLRITPVYYKAGPVFVVRTVICVRNSSIVLTQSMVELFEHSSVSHKKSDCCI